MSIAEKLRDSLEYEISCSVDPIAIALTDDQAYCKESCAFCRKEWVEKLANAIEAELSASKPAQLPEGIEWPRFESGELVEFGDAYVEKETPCVMRRIEFKQDVGYKLGKGANHHWRPFGTPVKRPEPEVLDAEGVPIKVGDTVYSTNDSGLVNHPFSFIVTETNRYLISGIDEAREGLDRNVAVLPCQTTHRKPDTQEAIDADATLPPRTYYAEHIGHDVGLKDDAECTEAMILDLLRRQRKLLGGE